MILVVSNNQYDQDYAAPFTEPDMPVVVSAERDILFELDKYNLIVLPGGTDVNPKYYHELPHEHTHYTSESSALDEIILGYGGVIDKAADYGVPIVGICKGSQQLCVHQGGRLHQHVENHTNHYIRLLGNPDEIIFTSGGHHQMADLEFVRSVDYDVLATAWKDVSGLGIEEPEIVHYPDINALGIQYHPEWCDSNSRAFNLPRELVEKYL